MKKTAIKDLIIISLTTFLLISFGCTKAVKIAHLKWKFKTKGFISNLAVDDDSIYFSDGRFFYYLDRLTGQRKWKYKAADIDKAVDNKNIIFFTDSNGWIQALDKETGKRKWKFEDNMVSNPFVRALFIENKLIYSVLVDYESLDKVGVVHIIDPKTGKARKRFEVKNAESYIKKTTEMLREGKAKVDSYPSWDTHRDMGYERYGNTYFEEFDYDSSGSYGSETPFSYGIKALDVKTNRQKWKVHDKQSYFRLISAVKGVVFIQKIVGSKYNRFLWALDSTTGQPKWKVATDNHLNIRPPVIASGNIVYFSADNDSAEYLDAPESGDEQSILYAVEKDK